MDACHHSGGGSSGSKGVIISMSFVSPIMSCLFLDIHGVDFTAKEYAHRNMTAGGEPRDLVFPRSFQYVISPHTNLESSGGLQITDVHVLLI